MLCISTVDSWSRVSSSSQVSISWDQFQQCTDMEPGPHYYQAVRFWNHTSSFKLQCRYSKTNYLTKYPFSVPHSPFLSCAPTSIPRWVTQSVVPPLRGLTTSCSVFLSLRWLRVRPPSRGSTLPALWSGPFYTTSYSSASRHSTFYNPRYACYVS